MGVYFQNIQSYCEYSTDSELPESRNQVFELALKSLDPLIKEGLPEDLQHVVVATSCPDAIAPSLGQMIQECFHKQLSTCETIDLVQGCAGGVAALVLGSQLALLGQNSTLVIQSDAARKATSRNSSINKIFGNGSFACLIRHDGSSRKLLHHKSVHYEGLSKIVNIRLGHDADEIIKKEYAEMIDDPRKHLGLTLDNAMAMKLVREAENFYLRFIEESTTPDVMILHQVNPQIISHLKQVFLKYKVEFIDVASKIGNCGSATVGIALASLNGNLAGKKILLCSFGTGGVISAGLWQN